MKYTSVATKIKIIIGISLLGVGIVLAIVLSAFLTRNPCDVSNYNTQIEDIYFVENPEGLLVTWTQPSVFTTCSPNYDVSYTSALGEFSIQTDVERIIIPYEEFCLRVQVVIRASAGSDTPTTTTSFVDSEPLNVSFSTQLFNSEILFVRWTHRSQSWCSLTYDVNYKGHLTHSFPISVPEASFHFVFCMPASITITPKSNNGFYLPFTSVDATQFPDERNINSVQLSVVVSSQAVSLSWPHVQSIGTCDLFYRIQIETDRVMFTNVTPMNFTVITRDQFCFFVQYQIEVLMGNSVGSPISGSGIYGLPQVEDLTLTRSMEDNTLIAAWQEHWLQKQCSLQYVVTYAHSTNFNTFTVNQPTETFDMAYCADTTVGVSILYNSRQGLENNATHLAEYPISVDPAGNPSIKRSETSALVSWDSHPSLSECSELYTVLAEHESGQSNTCQGASSCEIFLDDVCPTTNFTIFQTTERENLTKWKYTCLGDVNAV